jgi:hypothetical protein
MFLGILHYSFKPKKEDKKTKINTTINLNLKNQNK